MKTLQHSPGPWKYSAWQGASGDPLYKVWRGAHLIADIQQRPLERHRETIANARLIAAAPDLAAACDECDTAFATITIGRDHGLTPQGLWAMKEAWLSVCEAMYKATKGNHWLAYGDLLRTELAQKADLLRAELAKEGGHQ